MRNGRLSATTGVDFESLRQKYAGMANAGVNASASTPATPLDPEKAKLIKEAEG